MMTNDGGAEETGEPMAAPHRTDQCVRCGKGDATELGITQPDLVWFWCRRWRYPVPVPETLLVPSALPQ